jgi:AcrR family transcriptional regulator
MPRGGIAVVRKQIPPRERIMTQVFDTFYTDTIGAVGIDRIRRQAAVAKQTLYDYFPSKDDLVVAYVGARYEALWDWFIARIELRRRSR